MVRVRRRLELARLFAADSQVLAHAFDTAYASMKAIRCQFVLQALRAVGLSCAHVGRLDGPLYIYPKFFSASSSITPSLEGLADWVGKGGRAPLIDRFALRGDPTAHAPVRTKLDHFMAPQTLIGAKINYAFMMSYFLTHGAADGATMEHARFDEADVLALAAKASFEPVPGQPGQVILYLRSGETLVLPVLNQTPGDPVAPALTLRDMKFEKLTRPRLGQSGSTRLKALAGAGIDAAATAPWLNSVDALMKSGDPNPRVRRQ